MKLLNQRFYSCFKKLSDFIIFKKGWLILLLAIFFQFFSGNPVWADYARYTPGEAVTLGEFVFDDNYVPSNVSCSTTVYTPAGVVSVNDVQLSSVASGWHYYTFTPSSIEGLWSASIYCGSAANGDLVRIDKSFIVASNRLTDKTLTGGGSLATESYIDSATSSLKTEIDQNQTLISALSSISAADVWSYAGRDLDRPTIVTASTSAAVWERATSTFVNSGTVGKQFVDNLDEKISTRGTSTLSAADVWDAASRTLTDYSTSSIALSVWSSAARTLTNYGNNITAADVWNVLTSTMSTIGSIGKQLRDNTDIQSSAIYNEVLQNRTLINNLNNISATEVWSYVGRDLDNPVTVSASTTRAVWSAATSTLTSSGSIGKQIADNLDAKVSTVGGGSLTAADIWSAANRTLTDYSTSSIALSVWSNAARTLTNYGNNISAADVWTVLTSTLNTLGSIGQQLRDNTDLPTSDVYNEVLQNRTLINNLNDISAADVWSYVGRDLDNPVTVVASTSQAIWNIGTSSLTNSGTIGKLIVDNLDAKVSTRGTSSLTAADIWSSANRTLTDYATSSITFAIWNNANRTLTSYGNDITAADVWNVLSTSLVANNSVGKLLVDNVDAKVSSVADSVWTSGTRNLTDYATSSIATAVWNNSTRSLTTFGSLASDVWSDLSAPTRLLTGKNLSGGGDLATESYLSSSLNSATSTIINEIVQNRTLINNLNNISATDVWSYVGRDLDRPTIVTASTSAAVWERATASFVNSGTIGKLFVDNLDAKISTRGTSTLSAADVWNAANRTLTDYSTSSISQAIWANANRTLTSYGNDITAADVWNVLSATLSVENSIGKQLIDNVNTPISTVAGSVWSVGNRSLTDYSTSSIANAVWNNSTRSLTTFGTLATDVWSDLIVPNRLLTGGSLTGGGSLATDVSLTNILNSATSTIINEIVQNRTLINNLNNISATDVWSYVGRDLDRPTIVTASTSAAVWERATASFVNSGTIGKLFVDNLDAQVSSRSTSTLTASDIWSAASRTLTDYSTSTITQAIWSSAARTLTNYGNDITAADVWNILTSTLNTAGSIGKQMADSSGVDSASIINEIVQNRTLINNLNNISATDVWSYVGRDLDRPTIVTASTSAAVWERATSTFVNSGTVGKQFVDNLDAKISTRGTSVLTAADVWDAANRTLTDYSTSSIALSVWSSAARTLTNYGNDITAADVWNVLTSTLTTIGSIGKQTSDSLDYAISSRASLTSQQAGWEVKMSDADSISAGKTYRAKLYVFNFESIPTDSNSSPSITIYDANRNVVVGAVGMSKISNGVYEYTYIVPNGAESGLWESAVSTEVTPGKVLQTNDFWVVAASPAQVIINSITDNEAPSISANVTITNEGMSGYEYQYEWCVVASADNACGGGNDVFYASAAKFINPGEDWNTDLTATVASNGNYLFKLVVYFGTESSGSSRTFTVVGGNTGPVVTPPSGGGGGGGGGGVYIPPVATTTPISMVCSGADFNLDKKVNSIDFSILLAYWKATPPFRNPCVDVNNDKNINSVDFSILMFEWGVKK